MYPSVRRIGGWTDTKTGLAPKEQIHYPRRVQTPDCPAPSLVTVPTVRSQATVNNYADTMRSEMFQF